ncbi:hypothetical protein BD309DRAFT_1062532, partial [Dichomitus squalens]
SFSCWRRSGSYVKDAATIILQASAAVKTPPRTSTRMRHQLAASTSTSLARGMSDVPRSGRQPRGLAPMRTYKLENTVEMLDPVVDENAVQTAEDDALDHLIPPVSCYLRCYSCRSRSHSGSHPIAPCLRFTTPSPSPNTGRMATHVHL